MIDKELFKKTERKLNRYYKYKREIQKMYRKVEMLEEQILSIDNQMKDVHKYIDIDPYKYNPGMSEKVQISLNSTSYVEKEMENAVTQLEREKCRRIKDKGKTKFKIMEVEKEIEIIDNIMDELDQDDRKFIEYLYKENKKIVFIAIKLNFSIASAYRKKNRLILSISKDI